MSDNPRVLGNRYEVGDLIGRGGMAEVHIGRDTRLGRVVAIKLLRTDLARDPIFQARFRREAQSAAALNHPAIVAVYDTGEEQLVDAGGSLIALPYIVMEYVEGRTLREMLFDGTPLEVSLAVELTMGVLSALDYSHRSGIVHRDIKPANVMLTPAGDVKVMDFGIARALADVSATMTQTQAVIGTAQYLSPEQARGETVDARSDLYSAACLLFELVTGRPPFVADSPVAVAYQHVREAPPLPSSLNPALSEGVDRVLMHALSKDREARYQSAAEFRADLENLRRGRPVSAPGMPQLSGAAGAFPATEHLSYPAGQGATRAMTSPMATTPGQTAQGYGPPGGYGEADYGRAYPEADRRRGERREADRGIWYVLLGLVAVAVFAAVAYLVFQLTSQGVGAQQVPVPRVTGLTEEVATATLRTAGLEVDPVAEASDTLPAGIVISQDPETGVRVDRGTVVTLKVSSGSGEVQVPDVKNQSEEAARAALQEVGLTVEGTKTVDNVPGVDKGNVSSTEPKATTVVPKGSGVTLLVSSGKVEVPDVTGQSIGDAQQALNDRRITFNQVSQPSDQPEGTVLSQDPPGGEKVDVGTSITLVVAAPQVSPEPPPSEPVPSEVPSAAPSPSP